MKPYLLLALVLISTAAVAQQPELIVRPTAQPKVTFFHDKPVLFLAGAQVLSQLADAETTKINESHGGVELDPISRALMGSRPTWGRMILVGSAEDAAAAFLAHKLRNSKGPERHLWWMPQVLATAAHAACASSNVAGMLKANKQRAAASSGIIF